MRIVLGYQHVTIEAIHLGYAEYTYATEGAGIDRQYLALRNIGVQRGVGRALQTEEGDLAGLDASVQCAAGDIGLAVGLQGALHDQLILHGRVDQMTGGSVAAVEAHEGLALTVLICATDALVIDVTRYGVVDVQQGGGDTGCACADVLAQRAVDINLARYRHQAGSHAAIDIAGNELELGLECRPALVGERNVLAHALVALGDVQQSGFVLRQTRQYSGHLVALAQLALHIGDDLGDALVARMLVVLNQQVQLGILLNLNAQIVQRLYGSIARDKVVGTRTESDYLKSLNAQVYARHGHELGYHGGDLVGGAYRILGYIGVYAAQLEVVRCVQHAAVCVAATVEHILAGLFGGGNEHYRTVKVLCNQSFGSFGTEIAQIHNQRVYAILLELFQSLCGIMLVFDGCLYFDYLTAGLAERFDHRVTAGLAQSYRETVTAYGDYAQFYLRYIAHDNYLLYCGYTALTHIISYLRLSAMCFF